MDRYARQRQLAAVGDRGQERIAAATYVVAGDSALSSAIEREYLARAGAERFAASGSAAVEFAHAGAFRDSVAREFAQGAWRALVQLKNALEQGP